MKDKHQSLTRRSEDLYSNGVQHSPTAQDGFQENGCVDGCAARNGNQITESKEKEVPPRSTFLVDPANLCTLSGAIFSTIALAYIWNGRLVVFSRVYPTVSTSQSCVIFVHLIKITLRYHPSKHEALS